MDRQLLKQECPLFFVVLAWLMYAGGLVFFAIQREFAFAAGWFLLAPLTMWAYIHWFPSISSLMGYGRVDDRPVGIALVVLPAEVTLYTALGCPFCPIVKRRLLALQERLGFQIRMVDVTARPDILTRKGIWSVPVVEVGGRTLVGYATSDQLVSFIAAEQKAA